MILLNSCCTQHASKFAKLGSGHRTRKGPAFILIPKKSKAKECSNYHTTAFISHASKVMLKTLQARFRKYKNQKLSDEQAAFKNGKGNRGQIANICQILEKAKDFQKTSTSASLTTLKSLTVWITTSCGKNQTIVGSH